MLILQWGIERGGYGSEREVYQTLWNTLSGYKEILTNTFLFCPLPLDSYHVTLCDGLNDSNLVLVDSDVRRMVEDMLSNMPESLEKGNSLYDMLHLDMDGALEFRFDRLVKWGNSVLVARITPIDRSSSERLAEIVARRKQVIDRFFEQFGVRIAGDEYSPHISLGYFANREYAELSSFCVSELDAQFRRDISGKSIRFTSCGLYGFQDMARFIRHIEPTDSYRQ